jgi:hypothetical protein
MSSEVITWSASTLGMVASCAFSVMPERTTTRVVPAAHPHGSGANEVDRGLNARGFVRDDDLRSTRPSQPWNRSEKKDEAGESPEASGHIRS